MRIDVDSSVFRPGYVPQKTSGNAQELNAKGEFVRGKIVDVNQNMVLIQTSTGKQFSATTTIPVENYIDQEMAFTILMGEDGQILLKPEIDETGLNKQLNLKVEDILLKMGKQITPENKELVKQMMSSSIPITLENFDELRETMFSANILQSKEFSYDLKQGDSELNLNQLVKQLQMRKDFNVAGENTTSQLPEGLNVKDFLLLKNLGIEANINNIKALYDIFQKIDLGKTDLTGIKSMLASAGFFENVKNEIDLATNQNLNILTNEQKSQIETLKSNLPNTSKMEFVSDKELTQFKFPDLASLIGRDSKLIKGSFERNLALSEVIDTLKEIDTKLTKNINSDGQNSKEQLSIDYKSVKNELKTVSEMLGRNSDISQFIDKQIMPKLDVLANMQDRYNYNIIPLQIQNQDNVLQFYSKKKPATRKNEDAPLNIGLCLNTKNYGIIKSMLSYKKGQMLNIDFYTQDIKTKNYFQNNIKQLNDTLKQMGFYNLNITVQQSLPMSKSKEMIDDVLYDNKEMKSFELWI
ncbi:hypothetical protein FL857_00525 [Criibacterium bergeronii]|uniref:Flagellar hook-length control protein FliK n=1 Tax=Criibacterium bergeronii TaxID=1871336 RepID=A0A552VDQ2_9FIRM|nr:hypothetical protein [Criibacterium bergeronii]TRW28603.1 hypothetical protein FL857_00525 [Criibacterium bergeronii]